MYTTTTILYGVPAHILSDGAVNTHSCDISPTNWGVPSSSIYDDFAKQKKEEHRSLFFFFSVHFDGDQCQVVRAPSIKRQKKKTIAV